MTAEEHEAWITESRRRGDRIDAMIARFRGESHLSVVGATRQTPPEPPLAKVLPFTPRPT